MSKNTMSNTTTETTSKLTEYQFDYTDRNEAVERNDFERDRVKAEGAIRLAVADLSIMVRCREDAYSDPEPWPTDDMDYIDRKVTRSTTAARDALTTWYRVCIDRLDALESAWDKENFLYKETGDRKCYRKAGRILGEMSDLRKQIDAGYDHWTQTIDAITESL